MFQDNLSVPFSRVKKSKSENIAGPKLTDIIFFLGGGFHPLSKFFLKKHNVL